MAFAWYRHLKFKTAPLMLVILASWGIVFLEYCLAVPADRFGHRVCQAAELKVMQEAIAFAVFIGFAVLYLKEGFAPFPVLGIALICAGSALVFLKPRAAMPFPDHVFRHMPELIGRVQDPETSRFRDMMARIEEFDAQAIADGRGLEWRLTDEAREKTRRALLKGREGQDLWIFAYGSLIWDPGIRADEFRHACLRGWRRSFCMHLDGGRGSPDRPGLMAALDADPGHACQGVILRLPAEIAEEETRILWMREMIAGAYRPAFMPVDTPQGPVEAIAFLANPEHPRHVVLPRLERARRIAVAEGRLGTNLEYLENLLASLHVLGIEDPEMAALLETTLQVRRKMGAA